MSVFRRNLINKTKSVSPLPSGYQQVEFIENTSTSYIQLEDSLSLFKSTSEIVFTNAVGGSRQLFGNSEAGFYWGVTGGGLFEMGPSNRGGSCSNNVRYNVVLDGTESEKKLYVDNKKITSRTVSTSTSGYSIFAASRSFNMLARLYYFKLEDDTARVLHELLPCYRIADNVAGMYDLITQTFYTNSGDGQFVIGDNV